jgi:hypothetical protein
LAGLKEPENKRIDIAAVRKANKPDADAGKAAEKTKKNDGTPDLGFLDDPSVKDLLEKFTRGETKEPPRPGTKTNPNDKSKLSDDLKNVSKNGEIDIDKLLDNPDLGKLLKGALGEDNGLDIGELLKSPLAKDMMKNMLSQKQPEGAVSADGKSYTNEALGIAIKLPESAKDWKLSGRGAVPMMVASIEGPGGASVSLASQPLPLQMPVESMGPMVEMGLKFVFKNYTKHKEGVIGEGAAKGYELQFTGDQEGARVRMTHRVYMRPGKMLIVQAIAPENAWDKNEKALGDILNAIKITEPKPEKDKTDARLKE